MQALIARLKGETDTQIRGAISLELRKDKEFLDQLVTFLPSVTDSDDADDPDNEDEEETRQLRVGRDAVVETLMRAIRAKARSAASGRTFSKQARNGKIIDWLGERGLSADALRSAGQSLQIQASARRFLNPLRRFIDGMAGRYRRFRRERQTENRWYAADGFAVSDLNPLETDIILLAVMRAGRALLTNRGIAGEVDQGRHPALAVVRGLFRSQVLVDETTDFSPVQFNCMAQLCDVSPICSRSTSMSEPRARQCIWASPLRARSYPPKSRRLKADLDQSGRNLDTSPIPALNSQRYRVQYGPMVTPSVQ